MYVQLKGGTIFKGAIDLFRFFSTLFLGAFLFQGQLDAEVFVIQEIDNRIEGFTQTWALSLQTGLFVGRTFDSRQSMNVFLDAVRQDLWNKRLYKSLEWGTEDLSDDQARANLQAVRVIWKGVETWTILPLPFYSYDSNNGHNYGGVLFYENFAGTLTSFFLSAGRNDKNWDINTRLSNIKLFGTSFGMNFRQWWKTEEKKENDRLILSYSYDSSDIGFGTGFILPWDWSIGLSFSAYGKYNTVVRQADLGQSPAPSGWTYGFSSGLGRGDMNWVRNFRRGLTYGVGYSAGINPAEVRLNQTYSAFMNWFSLWGPVNVLMKYNASWTPAVETTGLGGQARGVEDSVLWGDKAFSANLAAGVSLFDIPDWCEVQVFGFFDAVAALGSDWAWAPDRMGLGAGGEILVFPHFFKSLIVRFTIGFDLTRAGKIEWVLRDGLSM